MGGLGLAQTMPAPITPSVSDFAGVLDEAAVARLTDHRAPCGRGRRGWGDLIVRARPCPACDQRGVVVARTAMTEPSEHLPGVERWPAVARIVVGATNGRRRHLRWRAPRRRNRDGPGGSDRFGRGRCSDGGRAGAVVSMPGGGKQGRCPSPLARLTPGYFGRSESGAGSAGFEQRAENAAHDGLPGFGAQLPRHRFCEGFRNGIGFAR
jgi:hypothetical protein